MCNYENVHIVEDELAQMEGLFKTFRSIHLDYLQELKTDEERKIVRQKFATKENSSLEFRQEVRHWICRSEQRLADELKSVSTVSRQSHTSRRSLISKVSSRSSAASAKAREKVRLAEMLVEKSMFKKTQMIREAQLDIEIAKSQASEKVYAEMEKEESQEDRFPELATRFKHSIPAQTHAAPFEVLSPLLSNTPKDNEQSYIHEEKQEAKRENKDTTEVTYEKQGHEVPKNHEMNCSTQNATSVHHNEASSEGTTITQRQGNGLSKMPTQGHRQINEGSANHNATSVRHNEASSEGTTITQRQGNGLSKMPTQGHRQINEGSSNHNATSVHHNEASSEGTTITQRHGNGLSKMSTQGHRQINEVSANHDLKQNANNETPVEVIVRSTNVNVKENANDGTHADINEELEYPKRSELYLPDEYRESKELAYHKRSEPYLPDDYIDSNEPTYSKCTKSPPENENTLKRQTQDVTQSAGNGKPILYTPQGDEFVCDHTYFLQQHREMVASQQQLSAAMALPKPKIPTFTGEVTEYKAFVIAFDTRIAARTAASADRLYYLQQHLQGEPRELISG